MRVGFPAVNFARLPRRPNVAAPGAGLPATGTLTLTAIPSWEEKRIWQRITTAGGGQGKGTGSMTLPITAASAGTVNARVVSDDGVTVLQDLGQLVITDGQTSLPIAFIDARLGWFFLEFQGSNGVWQRMTYKCGMGALFGFAGQSLLVRFFGRQDGQSSTYAATGGSPSTLVANDNTAVVVSYADGNAYTPTPATAPWQTPGDNSPSTLNGLRPNGLGIGRFLNQMVALLGVNCGAFGRAQGAQELYTFIANPVQANWTILNNIITRIGGAFEGFYWGQGHSNSVAGQTANSYATGLGLIFSQLTAVNSFAGYGKFVWTIPAVSNNQFGTVRQYNNVRKGAQTWCAANSATYIHMLDITLVDGIHPTNFGGIGMADHMYRAARAQYGASSGLGPALVSATRIDATTTRVVVTDVGQGTLDLKTASLNRWFVMQKGLTNIQASLNDNRWPVSTVTLVNKTTIDLTHAAAGDGNEFDVFWNYPCGPTDTTAHQIYDDRVDADGITLGRILQANSVPMVAAALNPVGTVAAPPGGYVTQPSPFNMTATGASYAAAPGALGQEMVDGTAVTGIAKSPLFYPVTVEGWFVCPQIIGTTQVLVGSFGNDVSIGISSAGKLYLGTKTLVAGRRYYFAFQLSAAGSVCYLYDETLNEPTTEGTTATVYTMPPRATGQFSLRNFKGSFPITGTPKGAIDEVAMFESVRYSNQANFAANRPTAPLTNAEANIVALYHCDGNVNEAIAA